MLLYHSLCHLGRIKSKNLSEPQRKSLTLEMTLPANGRFLFQAVNILWAASLRSHTMIYRPRAMTIKHSIKNQ